MVKPTFKKGDWIDSTSHWAKSGERYLFKVLFCYKDGNYKTFWYKIDDKCCIIYKGSEYKLFKSTLNYQFKKVENPEIYFL